MPICWSVCLYTFISVISQPIGIPFCTKFTNAVGKVLKQQYLGKLKKTTTKQQQNKTKNKQTCTIQPENNHNIDAILCMKLPHWQPSIQPFSSLLPSSQCRAVFSSSPSVGCQICLLPKLPEGHCFVPSRRKCVSKHVEKKLCPIV